MQKATERGWENCLRQMGETREVVFYGNSITRNGHWQEWFPEKQVCNLGLGGDDLLGLKRRIGMVTCLAPSKVFVMGGINGIRNTTYESFEIQYSNLCQTLSDSLPKAKVFLQSMLPVDSSRFEDYASNEKIDSCNRIIKNLAEQYGMTFVDLFSSYLELSNTLEIYSDGIHLKEEYYYLWVETITA